MERSTISRNQLVNQILHIGHGNLATYTTLGLKAGVEEPELFAHLIAWNQVKGEVRDSKIALPVLAIRGTSDAELIENAVAHLVSQDPRSLAKAIEFNKALTKDGYRVVVGAGRVVKESVARYLTIREENPGWWDRTVLQHRKSMKALYALFHTKPSQRAQAVLFDNKKPRGSVFEAVSQLRNMAPKEAAGTILNFKIPYLIAVGAVGGVKDKPDIIMALIEQTSGSELINNTEMFRRLGVFDNPVLKATFDHAVEKAKKDKRVSTLKAGKAAAASGDKKVAAKLEAVQAEKLDQLGGIEGDWLVLGDCSGSMEQSVELAKQVSALIAQQVKGAVHLIFFNRDPYGYNVTGRSLDEIKAATRHIRAGGQTCIGCGLELLRVKNILVNGIVICSDGGENVRPLFGEVYQKYAQTTGIEPSVYHLWMPGERNVLGPNCSAMNVQVQMFDVSRMDYYALPNLVKSLRTNRFTLVDEIMNTPLLRLSDVLKSRKEKVC
jgi:hypothetical protein